MSRQLRDRIALVAGGTRGAGRGIALELGVAGATVYVTGRTTRDASSPMNRPETIEETAELVSEAGGEGIAVRVDHSRPEEVAALIHRIDNQQGRVDVLVNDVWGGDRFIGRQQPTPRCKTPGLVNRLVPRARPPGPGQRTDSRRR